MRVREIVRSLERWQMREKDLRRRMVLAPTPRESAPHTIGRWAPAFGEGGPAALLFDQTGGSPPPLTKRSRRS